MSSKPGDIVLNYKECARVLSRAASRYTLGSVATKAGMHKNTLVWILGGNRTSIEGILKLADILSVDRRTALITLGALKPTRR